MKCSLSLAVQGYGRSQEDSTQHFIKGYKRPSSTERYSRLEIDRQTGQSGTADRHFLAAPKEPGNCCILLVRFKRKADIRGDKMNHPFLVIGPLSPDRQKTKGSIRE